jgi:3-hydroxyacyl-CoA dehydrogenase/3-hydroxy-2-methylbutyryl-CoA dehydrogenase
MQLDNRTALVAGGASGLGAATARRLHAAGATVIIGDLDTARGVALGAELGERARFAEMDVTDPASVQAAVDLALGAGGLRVAVCCAGIAWGERTTGKRGPHTLEPFSKVVTVNLIGTFNLLRLAATAMAAVYKY